MFASKTPRDLTSHAATICGRCDAEFAEDGIYSEDEHRDYHQPAQHNEPNPILCGMREDVDEFTKDCGGAYSLSDHAKFWLRCLPDQEEQDLATPEQIDHARRVLARLANLAQNGVPA